MLEGDIQDELFESFFMLTAIENRDLLFQSYLQEIDNNLQIRVLKIKHELLGDPQALENIREIKLKLFNEILNKFWDQKCDNLLTAFKYGDITEEQFSILLYNQRISACLPREWFETVRAANDNKRKFSLREKLNKENRKNSDFTR